MGRPVDLRPAPAGIATAASQGDSTGLRVPRPGHPRHPPAASSAAAPGRSRASTSSLCSENRPCGSTAGRGRAARTARPAGAAPAPPLPAHLPGAVPPLAQQVVPPQGRGLRRVRTAPRRGLLRHGRAGTPRAHTPGGSARSLLRVCGAPQSPGGREGRRGKSIARPRDGRWVRGWMVPPRVSAHGRAAWRGGRSRLVPGALGWCSWSGCPCWRLGKVQARRGRVGSLCGPGRLQRRRQRHLTEHNLPEMKLTLVHPRCCPCTRTTHRS